MNAWYAHYPGDYARDTAHLTMQEDGAYRRLLDHYYSVGRALPAGKDALYRIARAFTDAERAAVDSVLLGFFQLREDGYHNGRADLELDRRAEHHERLSRGAHKTNEKRWGSHRSATRLALASPQPQPKPKEEKKEGAPASPSLSFSCEYFSVTEKQDAALGEAFPWVDLPSEYRKVHSWLEANPERRPKKATRFLHNWFSRISQPKEAANGKKLTGDALTEANLRATGLLQ